MEGREIQTGRVSLSLGRREYKPGYICLLGSEGEIQTGRVCL